MPLEFADENDFNTKVATIVSQVISPRMKGMKKELEDATKNTLEALAKAQGEQLDQKLQTLAETIKAGGGKKKGDKKDGEEPEVDENSPALRTMQKKIEELEKQNKQIEEARKAEADKSRSMTVRARLREVLEAGGVTDPHKLRAASAILISEDRRVAFSEALEDAAWLDVDGAPVELETGVRTWLKSEEGEHYMAPTGAAGAGTRPGKKTDKPAQPQRMTEAELGLAFMQAAQGTTLPGT